MSQPSKRYELTWPEGRGPGRGYPLCPECGHDFGSLHGGGDSDPWCAACMNAGTQCTAPPSAVFDAIQAAEDALPPSPSWQDVQHEDWCGDALGDECTCLRALVIDARSWARHGYEIGQRSCTWSDQGVAPTWLTEEHADESLSPRRGRNEP